MTLTLVVKSGKRRLTSIEDSVDVSIRWVVDCIKKSKERANRDSTDLAISTGRAAVDLSFFVDNRLLNTSLLNLHRVEREFYKSNTKITTKKKQKKKLLIEWERKKEKTMDLRLQNIRTRGRWHFSGTLGAIASALWDSQNLPKMLTLLRSSSSLLGFRSLTFNCSAVVPALIAWYPSPPTSLFCLESLILESHP